MKIRLAVFILLALMACGRDKTVIEETPPIGEHAIERFTVTETEGGKLKMTLESEAALIDENINIARIKLPVAKFYKEGAYASTLIMESAEIDLETYNVRGIGKCSIDTAEAERLETTDLRYDAAKQKISSSNNVKIIRTDETVYGTAFEADTNLENIIIENQRVIINRNNP